MEGFAITPTIETEGPILRATVHLPNYDPSQYLQITVLYCIVQADVSERHVVFVVELFLSKSPVQLVIAWQ